VSKASSAGQEPVAASGVGARSRAGRSKIGRTRPKNCASPVTRLATSAEAPLRPNDPEDDGRVMRAQATRPWPDPAAQITSSVRAAAACRQRRPGAHVNQADRACQERGSGDLAQALFDYDSAGSHADPHLRDIVWRREDAILALAPPRAWFGSSWPGRDGCESTASRSWTAGRPVTTGTRRLVVVRLCNVRPRLFKCETAGLQRPGLP
jgi:hypothetical protein